MTSIRDVARNVGVSTATVSRALHGLPRVSEETRARVLVAASDLGYVASPSAASLKSGRTQAVGVVVPFVTRWYFATVVQAAEEVLSGEGYDLLLYNLGHGESRHRVFASHLLSKRVDAVLVMSFSLDERDRADLDRVGCPLAVVGARMPGWASVRIDDVAAARIATRHLLDLGHRRIAHVGGELGNPLGFPATPDRRAGYRTTLIAAGIEPEEELDVFGGWTVRGGQEAMRELLALGNRRPTAVFAASDEMAMGAVHAARSSGLRVPEDVSVVGIDDHEMSELLDLTTVAQPVHEQGRVAAQLLVEQLRAPAGAPPGARTVTAPVRLVVRGTTGDGPAGTR